MESSRQLKDLTVLIRDLPNAELFLNLGFPPETPVGALLSLLYPSPIAAENPEVVLTDLTGVTSWSDICATGWGMPPHVQAVLRLADRESERAKLRLVLIDQQGEHVMICCGPNRTILSPTLSPTTWQIFSLFVKHVHRSRSLTSREIESVCASKRTKAYAAIQMLREEFSPFPGKRSSIILTPMDNHDGGYRLNIDLFDPVSLKQLADCLNGG
ncbi:hypothetical protein KBD34_00025 [Patescibacteria group bacterium]|nr:hypothetical protein [Patescibacteria group bacterium]